MKYILMSLKLLAGAYLADAVSHSVSRLPALLTLRVLRKTNQGQKF
jgi:hypothetical protein